MLTLYTQVPEIKFKNIIFSENTHENTYKTPVFSGLNMSRGV